MGVYSALIAKATSVGNRGWPKYADAYELNDDPPGVAVVRPVLAPHTVTESFGGMLGADFVIPGELARPVRHLFSRDAYVWLFDDGDPIFYGLAEDFVTEPGGDVRVAVAGFWHLLGRTRMREVWDDWDLAKLAPVDSKEGGSQIEVTADGRLRFTLSKTTTNIAASTSVAADVFLFGEAVGTRDTKKIVAFEASASGGDYNVNANLRFRVYGRASPSATGPVLIYETAAAPPWTRRETAVANGWASSTGYRSLRVGLYLTAQITGGIGADRDLILDRFRYATRESTFKAVTASPTTTDIVIDLFSRRSSGSADALDLAQELWRGGLHRDSGYVGRAYGRDGVTGNVVASTAKVQGLGFAEWTTPAEILAALTALDGYRCGFYLPPGGRNGWSAERGRQWLPASIFWSRGSMWLTVPPELRYEAWPKLDSPDLLVYARRGAEVSADEAPQPLLSGVYVNYQTVRGVKQSVYAEDATNENYLYSQGVRRTEDWAVEPSVGPETAASLAQNMLVGRRQPVAAGKVTLYATRPESVARSSGGPVKLSTIRPGVVALADTRAAGLGSGRCTRVEWYGATLEEPERCELTLLHPGQVHIDTALARVTRSSAAERRR